MAGISGIIRVVREITMIMSFRCPPKLKERVDALVAAGAYPDFSSFCVAAVENQLLLEEANPAGQSESRPDSPKNMIPERPAFFSEAGGVDGPRGRRRGRPRTSLSSFFSPSEVRKQELTEMTVQTGKKQHELGGDHDIPTEFDLARLSKGPPFSLPSVVPDIFSQDQTVPIARWLFGQYNRLLPAKASARALAVISNEGRDSLVLGTVAPRIAELAAQLGEYLNSLDRRFGNHRDDALATAFPRIGVEGEKGRVRYQGHFVGHTVKGQQGGMLVGLKLAAIHLIKNKPHIFPPTAGWEFARLLNPVLDATVDQKCTTLNDGEVAFLLRHIRENVPVELFAYRVLLSLIGGGRNTPESVNEGLSKYLESGKSVEDEQDFISTQKNGVLGRMGDLELVARERQGTRITYHLTPAGKAFLDEIGRVAAASSDMKKEGG
jgi:Arc/MetJ-type ribon-helix-helix transcriptional regulator